MCKKDKENVLTEVNVKKASITFFVNSQYIPPRQTNTGTAFFGRTQKEEFQDHMKKLSEKVRLGRTPGFLQSFFLIFFTSIRRCLIFDLFVGYGLPCGLFTPGSFPIPSLLPLSCNSSLSYTRAFSL